MNKPLHTPTRIIALLIAFLVLVPGIALASDISGARYQGVITISNNGTALTNAVVTRGMERMSKGKIAHLTWLPLV